MQISTVLSKAERMFEAFNEHFYSGELATPAITVHPDGGRGAYGWASVQEIWSAEDGQYRELNICAEYLNRPLTEVARTILHEMAHLYNIQNGIMDTSNNGYYHNKRFKTTAEDHGLIIGKGTKYGWTITTLAPDAEAWLLDTFGEQGLNVSRMAEIAGVKTGRSTSKNRSIKYVCPCCGTSVRATREVNIKCGDCEEEMERA